MKNNENDVIYTRFCKKYQKSVTAHVNTMIDWVSTRTFVRPMPYDHKRVG